MKDQAVEKLLNLYMLSWAWALTTAPHGAKGPTHKGWQQRGRTQDELDRDFATGLTNVGVLLGPLSGDLVDVDLDCPEARDAAPAFLPATGAWSGRPSNHKSHALYRCAGIKTCRLSDPVTGAVMLELRGEGTQTLVAPSIHPSGEQYTWDILDPAGPAAVESGELVRRTKLLYVAALAARHWPGQGARHMTALALAGGLLKAGVSQADVEAVIRHAATFAGDPEVYDRVGAVAATAAKLVANEAVTSWKDLEQHIDAKVVKAIRKAVGTAGDQSWTPPTAPAAAAAGVVLLTDVSNAARFLDRYGDTLRWDPESKRWRIFDGRRWRLDSGPHVEKLAQAALDGLEMDAALLDEPEQGALLAWVRKSRCGMGIANMLSRAKLPRVVAEADAFDRNPLLLNVANGTLDFETVSTRQHRAEDMLSQLCNADVAFDPSAACPTWDAFLHKVFAGNQAIIDFVQRAVGYSLTGETGERVIFVLHGGGGNGKSTMVNILQEILGDYAWKAKNALLSRRRNEPHPTEIANLKSKRFVVVSEPTGGWDGDRVKELTGNEPLNARRLYQDEQVFLPRFKLWVTVNRRPAVADLSDGFWDRILLIPFLVTIPKSERDVNFDAKLRAERPGILRWAVQGALAWKKLGLQPPPEVLAAVNSYRDEEDAVGGWLTDCVDIDPSDKTPSADLLASFRAWCSQHGRVLADSKFTHELTARGFGVVKGTHGVRCRQGLRLRQLVGPSFFTPPYGSP